MKQLCSVHTQVLASLTLFSPKQQLPGCFCASAISLPSLFPSAEDGEGRWDVQRSCCKPAVGRPPRDQSLQRSVPKVLYFPPRAPDSTDLLVAFGAEGRLPFFQPLIATSLQPAPPPLPHLGLRGLNPKQGSGEQRTGSGSPCCKPRAGIVTEPSRAISTAPLRSAHLSPFPRKLCLLSPPSNHCQICLPCCWTLTSRAQGLPHPAAAHWTVTLAAPLTRQGCPNPEFYCSFATGYPKDGILFFKTNCGDF